MIPEIIGAIGLLVFFVLIFLGMPLSFAFLAIGIGGLVVLRGWGAALSFLAISPYNTMTSYVWSVFPLFVFMGYLALNTGIANDFYEGAKRWAGHFRGGAAQTVVISNTAFSACVSDPMSAAFTFTPMAMPEMRKSRYNDSFSIGVILSSSALSTLIPPSGPLIIYGAITGNSIGALFLAGVVPGIILMVLFMILIYILCLLNASLGPASTRSNWKEIRAGTLKMWPFIIVILGIIGGIYAGIFTPTEAGAGGSFIMMLIAIARKKLTWLVFKRTLTESGKTISAVAFMIVGAVFFNTFLAYSGLTQILANSLIGISDSTIVSVILILFLYVILGMFLDPNSMMLLTVPIFYPIISNMGINPLQYGVMITLMLAIGALTPPFGILCIGIHSIVKEDIPLKKIYMGSAAFLIVLVLCTLFVAFVPAITTWLPSIMMQR